MTQITKLTLLLMAPVHHITWLNLRPGQETVIRHVFFSCFLGNKCQSRSPCKWLLNGWASLHFVKGTLKTELNNFDLESWRSVSPGWVTNEMPVLGAHWPIRGQGSVMQRVMELTSKARPGTKFYNKLSPKTIWDLISMKSLRRLRVWTCAVMATNIPTVS